MNIFRAGCCLYLYEDQPPPHLWVVLCDPIPPRDEILMVMLTTARAYTDDTVVLAKGDHPFVERNTAVSYGTADYRRVSALIAAMQRGRCELRETMSARILRRVQDGLLTSPRTVNAVRDRYTGGG
jgi:hypothetical protein